MTNTEHDSEMQKDAEECKLHRMAKVYDVLEMSPGSQNLCATQKESCFQTRQMTVIAYVSDTV